jgi:hypothetical protein
VAVAAGILELLNQETDTVRAQLLTLRQDVARLQRDASAPSSAELLEANEQLVLAALRAQAIADAATRRLRNLTGPDRPWHRWRSPGSKRGPSTAPVSKICARRTSSFCWPP